MLTPRRLTTCIKGTVCCQSGDDEGCRLSVLGVMVKDICVSLSLRFLLPFVLRFFFSFFLSPSACPRSHHLHRPPFLFISYIYIWLVLCFFLVFLFSMHLLSTHINHPCYRLDQLSKKTEQSGDDDDDDDSFYYYYYLKKTQTVQ